MSPAEAFTFIQNAATGNDIQYWVDLGCGSGTFTKALISLLPAGSSVIAVDREVQRLDLPGVDFILANFERDALGLSGLDGILMANSFHYVADKAALIKKLETMFAGTPRFIIIEYDTDRANSWVPYPITFENLQNLFVGLGYRVVKVSERPSAFRSGMMYCALIS